MQRKHMTQRHFAEHCADRALIQKGNIRITGRPWTETWKEHLPADADCTMSIINEKSDVEHTTIGFKRKRTHTETDTK